MGGCKYGFNNGKSIWDRWSIAFNVEDGVVNDDNKFVNTPMECKETHRSTKIHRELGEPSEKDDHKNNSQ